MGMTSILFNDAEQSEQIDNMPLTKGPKFNLVKIGQAGSEKTFKDYEISNMYIAQGQGQITQEDKILIVTKSVCYIVRLSQWSLIHFQKMILQHFPHKRIWECKFDLAIGQPRIII